MSKLECPVPAELVKERTDRILTQYRESSNLIQMITTYLLGVADLHNEVCDLPSKFDIDTATGDQLTLVGKRLGFPRTHKVCAIPLVHGFDTDGWSHPFINLSGFNVENSSWQDDDIASTSETTISDDEMYRRFLKCRRYQVLNKYDRESLITASKELFGEFIWLVQVNRNEVIYVLNRPWTARETELLKIFPRVLPITLGTRVSIHFGRQAIAGFGDGWNGFDDLGDNLTALHGSNWTATQSSQSADWVPEVVLDGDPSTFNHTQSSGDQWLQVDFDQPYQVATVEVTNRAGSWERLEGAIVEILDADGNVFREYEPFTLAELSINSVHRFNLQRDVMVSGVRIKHKDQFLHVSKIDVYAGSSVGEWLSPVDIEPYEC